MKFLSQEGLAYLWTKIKSRFEVNETAIAGKVDKVEGKGLSTEDYTTAEKAKLAGVEAGANAYTLPAATSGALGGVKQGANVSIAADGTLSATDTTYGEATTGSAGLMSATDKTKLNGIAEGANNYSLPTASSSVLGGIRLGSGLEYNSATGQTDAVETQYTAGSYIQINTSGSPSGHVAKEIACTYPAITNGSNVSIDTNEHGDIVINATDTTYSNATQSAAGLMSATDKTYVDGIPGYTEGRYIQFDNVGTASGHPIKQIKCTAPQVIAAGGLEATEENGTLTISRKEVSADDIVSGANVNNTSIPSSAYTQQSSATFFGDAYPALCPCWFNIAFGPDTPLAAGDKVTLMTVGYDFLASGIAVDGNNSQCGTFYTTIGNGIKVNIDKATAGFFLVGTGVGFYIGS